MNLSIIIVTATILLLIFAMVINIAQKTENFYNENASQFECGFNPMTPSHTPFSFQFFLVAVLFLIFDVEISIILAYPLEVNTATNTTLVILFLLGVLAGLAHEWNNGKLDWAN